jgi:RHS repeat-associated protein
MEVNHYDPWGVEYGLSENPFGIQPFKHQGKERMNITGFSLHNHGARLADNVFGRWTTRDPLETTDYWNSAYVYCGNNPVRYVDNDGRITIDKTTEIQYPALATYLKNLSNTWNNQSYEFRQAFIEASGLNEDQVKNMLEYGNGPRLTVDELDSDITQSANGATYLTENTTTGKVFNENGGEGWIALDNDVVGMLENASNPNERASGNIMVESTIFHELTHVGNVMTSGTTNGNYNESGKYFEQRAYGQDIDRGIVSQYVSSTTTSSVKLEPLLPTITVSQNIIQ